MAVWRVRMFCKPRRDGPRGPHVAEGSRDRPAGRDVPARNLTEALCDGPSKVEIHGYGMPRAGKPLLAELTHPPGSRSRSRARAKGLSIVCSIDGPRRPFSFAVASSSLKTPSGRLSPA